MYEHEIHSFDYSLIVEQKQIYNMHIFTFDMEMKHRNDTNARIWFHRTKIYPSKWQRQCELCEWFESSLFLWPLVFFFFQFLVFFSLKMSHSANFILFDSSFLSPHFVLTLLKQLETSIVGTFLCVLLAEKKMARERGLVEMNKTKHKKNMKFDQ